MRLVNARFNRFAEVLLAIGEVSLASVVVPYIINKSNTALLVLGIIVTMISFVLSMFFTRPQ